MKTLLKNAGYVGSDRPEHRPAKGMDWEVSMELWTIASSPVTGESVVEAANRLLTEPIRSPVLRQFGDAHTAALRLLELEMFGS